MKTDKNELFKSLVTNMNTVISKAGYIKLLLDLPSDEQRKTLHSTVVKSFRESVIVGWASPKADAEAKKYEFTLRLMGIDLVQEQKDVIDYADKFIEDYIEPMLTVVLEDPSRNLTGE